MPLTLLSVYKHICISIMAWILKFQFFEILVVFRGGKFGSVWEWWNFLKYSGLFRKEGNPRELVAHDELDSKAGWIYN